TINTTEYDFTVADKDKAAAAKEENKSLMAGQLQVVDAEKKIVKVGTVTITLGSTKPLDIIKSAKSVPQLQQMAIVDPSKKNLIDKAIKWKEKETALLPFGRLRTWPWFEYRGPNPYLLVTGQAKNPDGTRSVPWEPGHFLAWLANDQVPVLLEPLYKFIG